MMIKTKIFGMELKPLDFAKSEEHNEVRK